jgi:hypothetical protein
MSRTPAKFTQADIARTLRAAAQCGLRVEVVLEPDGRIRIVPSDAYTSQQVDTYDDIRL